MKRVQRFSLLLLLSSGCFAQSSQAAATADEQKYLRFILMTLASQDHSPANVKAFEDSLAVHLTLTPQEAAQIHAAGQALAALQQQLRASSKSTVAGKSSLSDAAAASLSALSDQMDQLVASLSNQILNSVRPETAAHIRSEARLRATAANKGVVGK